MDATLDLAAMLADFGDAVTIGGVAARALFDNGYASGFDIAGSAPSIALLSTAAPAAALGDAVSVGGVAYTVAGIEPDGAGVTVLRLQEV